MADIALESVSKRFRDVAAVTDLTLSIADGEFVVLLGPTGAGKTTTLRLVAGLEQPDTGRVLIAGQDATRLPAAARDVAFVFQQYSLYPHLSVFDNLAFPLRAPGRRIDKQAIEARVREVATLLRIDAKLANRATELSGGQMQRVAIGRALVREPQLFLMDEPLSSLDAKLRAELRIELKRIQRELGATILYVTHDQIEAMTMADRIGVMDHGRLVQVGTPREIFESPVNTYVAARLGQPPINLLPAVAFAHCALPAGVATVGARTEHLLVRKAANGEANTGRVHRIEHLGDQDHLHIELGGHSLVTLVEPGSDLAPGDAVSLDLDNPLLFDAAGQRMAA
jgi:multiple sugar transport system ATP-binding protein